MRGTEISGVCLTTEISVPLTTEISVKSSAKADETSSTPCILHEFHHSLFLCIICFRWMTPFLWNGSKNEIKKEDLHKVLQEDESKVLGDKLER